MKNVLIDIKRKLKVYKAYNDITKNQLNDKQIDKIFSSLDINEQIALLSIIERKDKETYNKVANNKRVALIKRLK